ncbi:MAG: hypothetical protein UHI81_02875 [Olegusella sp.]|nr:hypothetical protein [Olegusella sp.]
MSEISAFVDESGTMGRASRYYLLTLVFHNQSDDIRSNITNYEQYLDRADLPVIPLHCAPLMQGHFDYEGMDLQSRKKLLAAFFHFYRMLPVKYHTFIYLKKDFADDEALGARMRRDRKLPLRSSRLFSVIR